MSDTQPRVIVTVDAGIAEVRLHRALSPNRPLFVIQTDVRDFYPSVPHPLLLSAPIFP